MSSILALDVGSSAVRAALVTHDGALVDGATARSPHTLISTPPGASVTDAHDLRTRLEACIDDVLAHPAARDGIDAVGLAVLAGSLVGLGADGTPTTPLVTYADVRADAQADALAIAHAAQDVVARTGVPLHSAYVPARWAWLRDTQPGAWSRTAQWTDAATAMLRVWLGRPDVPSSYALAAWNGLLDRTTMTWDAAWLGHFGLGAGALPPLAAPNTPLGALVPAYARRWPALRGALVLPGLPDGAAASIGQGAGVPGTLGLTVGSTAAARVVVASATPPEVPGGLWAYGLDHGLHLVGGATTEGGNIFAWARRTLHLPPALADDPAMLDAALLARVPGAHGLTVLPTLAGERSPGWWAGATGTLSGLRLGTDGLDMLQALLESVAVRLAGLVHTLDPHGHMPIRAGGGALREQSALAQLICDALGRDLPLADTPEASLRGVALWVAAQRSGGAPASANVPPRVTLRPRAGHAAALADTSARQVALYHALRRLG